MYIYTNLGHEIVADLSWQSIGNTTDMLHANFLRNRRTSYGERVHARWGVKCMLMWEISPSLASLYHVMMASIMIHNQVVWSCCHILYGL